MGDEHAEPPCEHKNRRIEWLSAYEHWDRPSPSREVCRDCGAILGEPLAPPTQKRR